MGISQVGVSSTTVDTSKKPKLTYKTRYVWSTTSGSANNGALTYRAVDNCLYKLDNVDSTNQTFEKWNLSTNSASSLTRIYGTSDASPLSRPILVVGMDDNIYCNVNTANTTTYNMPIHKYTVSSNTWTNTGITGTQYSQNLTTLPPIPSHFTNSTDVLLSFGNIGSTAGNKWFIAKFGSTANREESYYSYEGVGGPSVIGSDFVYTTEIRDGHDKTPTGIYFIQHPNWAGTSSRDGIASVTYGYDTANTRTTPFVYTNINNGQLSQRNNSYEAKHLTHGNNTSVYILHPIIVESRYLFGGGQGGYYFYDIYNGSIYTSPMVGRGGTAGGTNPVYISATKKLYIHQRDNYLYEYDVTFE